ncbi:MAG: lamin tail domain-containing protein, partial [Anaerolineae bacterium]
VVATSGGDEDPGEYVEICNEEAEPVGLAGWALRSGLRQRVFTFPDHAMQPGACCRVYTNEDHPDWCGFSFDSDVDIWSFAQDCATLRDDAGTLVDGTCHCQSHSATLTLAATATTVQVGDPLTVTVTLFDHGCTPLGLPQYTLRIEPAGPEPVLTPSDPAPVAHYLGIGPGHSDAAEFALQAAGPGQAVLRASASFEVHLGHPGPAYWGGSSAVPLTITVMTR